MQQSRCNIQAKSRARGRHSHTDDSRALILKAHCRAGGSGVPQCENSPVGSLLFVLRSSHGERGEPTLPFRTQPEGERLQAQYDAGKPLSYPAVWHGRLVPLH